ncbi:hypothetical protein FRB96_005634 [Tulasnella sp. 330]|nr:hypothetical protein FRB96_005634 [Tulasnella sp. 330]KAG8886394.1 hypothetical protein FRB97_004929 [Tulasnella sp. 331]KAG8886855.1 hypothetical protein FRB98_000937 [Tulasnella sp. 332]
MLETYEISDPDNSDESGESDTTDANDDSENDILLEPQLAGNFDLYATWLPFLRKSLSPAGYEGVAVPGRFSGVIVDDPMSEEPFDVRLTHIVGTEELALTTAELTRAELDEDGCFVNSAKGSMKLTRVWVKEVKDGTIQELFQGFFTSKVAFSSIYAREGFESSAKHAISFWAIRAQKDAKDNEIGLSP